MILTYEKIREVKLNEKDEKLQKLPPNFFENAFNYIKLKKGKLEESSATSLIFSIFELRLKKIINLALLFYKSDKIPENLEKVEEKLYLDLVQTFRGFRDSFKKEFECKETRKENEPDQNILLTPKTTKKVRFLIDIPEIFLPSIGVCNFKKGEERELDENITLLLLEKKFCELV
jgi:DNA replication initiation complex subunit (GINS family)